MVMVEIASQLAREDYDKIRVELSVDHRPPPGLIVHALTIEDGKLRVFHKRPLRHPRVRRT